MVVVVGQEASSFPAAVRVHCVRAAGECPHQGGQAADEPPQRGVRPEGPPERHHQRPQHQPERWARRSRGKKGASSGPVQPGY